MGERFAGRYEFADVLGDGGMGTVWRVWDHREARYRAAKVLKQADSGSLLRFVRETSWRIDHDHVVTPLNWSGEDDRVLFTMPLVDGGTVGHLTRDFGPLPGVWVGELLNQLLSALDAVHRVGLVHRDVKPGNLLLDATGRGRPRLRLTDFGIAAPVDDARLTRVGEVIGTPGYQAPEAARGADPDPRQDLYAAGVVALELLSGERPPNDTGPIPSLSVESIRHSSLAPVIEQLVRADPQQRFAGAAEARTALHAAQPTEQDRRGADDVEVFDQLPPFPQGWGPDGPTGPAEGPVQPRSVSSAPLTPGRQPESAEPPRPSVPAVAAAERPDTGPATTAPAPAPARTRTPPRPRMLIISASSIIVGVVLIILGIVLIT